jgi:DNA-binding HxlR family transcriptional regulator
MALEKETSGSDEGLRCPVAGALELLGDRWTLVVVRDLVIGKSRYGEFLESPEGIPTNILADRLKRLEGLGILSREPYQERPQRFAYRLTDKGDELKPVLAALRVWGLRHIPGTGIPEALRHLLPVPERLKG